MGILDDEGFFSVLINTQFHNFTIKYSTKIENPFQESQNFYLLDVYAVCDGDREEEIQVSI